MSVSRRHVVGGLLVAVSVAASVPAAASASSGSGNGGTAPRRLAAASHSRQLRGAKDLGAAKSTTKMNLGFVLAPRNPAGLASFSTAVNTPGSPLYHHFLAKGEFATRFGASSAEIKTVRDFLAARGLHAGALQDGLTIPVTTTVAKVSKVFGTSVHTFTLRDGRRAFANTAAPLVPAAVASSLQDVLGLDNIVRPTSAIQWAKKKLTLPSKRSMVAPRLIPASTVTGPQACSGISGIAGSYTFNQLATAYGLNGLYSKDVNRTAPAVGIIELEPFSFSDIANFMGCYGIGTTSITTKSIGGGAGSGVGSGEAALDVETVLATAPDSHITVYSSPNSYAYYDYQAMASDDTAKTLTSSWGSCDPEAAVGGYAQSEATVFQQMAAQGQDLYAAAGDSGSEGCERMDNSTALSPGDPASQPYVTGIGGTRLQNTTPTESVWNDSADNHGAGTGGISSNWAMPAYQTGAGVVNDYSSPTPCGVASGYCREEPDVSASADPEEGYVIAYNGGWSLIGGTSAASPLWAGLMAEVSEACPVGFANPALYQMAANPGGVPAFHDVTVGNNDYGNLHSGAYPATTAYDQATGLGTPIATGIAAHLCSPSAPTNVSAAPGSSRATVSFSAPSANASTISSYTVTATDTTSADRGGQTVSGSSSPLTLSGLTNGDAYTFAVTATNVWGTGSAGTSSATTPSPALLNTTQQLALGDALHSADGKNTLIMQPDGNLVEYDDATGQPLWATGTNPSGSTTTMRSDGALVVTDASNNVLWNSGTGGNAGAYLTVLDGGALRIVGADATPLWQSSGIASGQTLLPGQSMQSPGGAYVVTLQSDGNLVEYDAAGHPVWATGTNPNGASAVMGSDGALVVKDSGGTVLWSSGTSGHSGAVAALTPTGQFTVSAGSSLLWGPGLLVPGRVMQANDTVSSPNGQYVLVMQGDGNLVEYSGGNAVWATGTQPAGAAAIMGFDGTFTVEDASHAVRWAAGATAGSGGYLSVGNDGVVRTLTSGGVPAWATSQLVSGESLLAGQSIVAPGGGYVLTMQSDGNLVEYAAGGSPVWASDTVSRGVKAVMRSSGSLAVVDAADADQFTTSTGAAPGSTLVLAADGTLSVVDLTGQTVWTPLAH